MSTASIRLVLCGLAAAMLAACGTPPASATPTAGDQTEPPSASPVGVDEQPQTPAQDSVHYYRGEVLTLSPDESTPFGPPTVSLVRRTLSPLHATIVEEVWQGEEHFVTTLLQMPNSNRFSATDKSNSFSGHLDFEGDPWTWSRWTYEITMTDGSGTLVGAGAVDAAGIHTRKEFRSPDGVARVVIKEELAAISEAEFAGFLPIE